MREILFRGKRVDNGAWIYGDFLQTKNYAQIWVDTDCGKWNYIVEKSTVSQYTGLKDKNGVKIFDGDILKFVNDDGDSSLYAVFWNESLLSWQVQELYSYTRGAHDCIDELCECGDMEVIGNVHDNPELMEV